MCILACYNVPANLCPRRPSVLNRVALHTPFLCVDMTPLFPFSTALRPDPRTSLETDLPGGETDDSAPWKSLMVHDCERVLLERLSSAPCDCNQTPETLVCAEQPRKRLQAWALHHI